MDVFRKVHSMTYSILSAVRIFFDECPAKETKRLGVIFIFFSNILSYFQVVYRCTQVSKSKYFCTCKRSRIKLTTCYFLLLCDFFQLVAKETFRSGFLFQTNNVFYSGRLIIFPFSVDMQ